LMAFIVPKFQGIFKDMLGGKPLPLITQYVIAVSDFVQNILKPPNLYYTVGAIVFVIVGWKVMTSSEGGRRFLDKVKLHTPLFGDLLRKGSISRFSRTLGTLVTSGVPILQALNITRD